eukprot:CAMPEP_0113587966 /NCGR_PEP_ID=MMETSP0015_2-20120614/35225_1 /TAXON_ID=2838 /ORGANISM="Odontella" /LENGTH=64 /DNA_ID=CAMNT_0000493731 /DNA_START=94 /DNA_END=284 /DNA_ORIENTATION=+ /assembly_acc=CAM_ASM_000160
MSASTRRTIAGKMTRRRRRRRLPASFLTFAAAAAAAASTSSPSRAYVSAYHPERSARSGSASAA